MGIGNLIKLRRTELGMSQKELAERCGYTNRSTISRIESGDRDVPVKQLKKIAAALGMDAEDLVVEAYKTALEDRPRQKDVEQIVKILDKKPEISRALLRYAQYLSGLEDLKE